jgi:hypothetical protein
MGTPPPWVIVALSAAGLAVLLSIIAIVLTALATTPAGEPGEKGEKGEPGEKGSSAGLSFKWNPFTPLPNSKFATEIPMDAFYMDKDTDATIMQLRIPFINLPSVAANVSLKIGELRHSINGYASFPLFRSDFNGTQPNNLGAMYIQVKNDEVYLHNPYAVAMSTAPAFADGMVPITRWSILPSS